VCPFLFLYSLPPRLFSPALQKKSGGPGQLSPRVNIRQNVFSRPPRPSTSRLRPLHGSPRRSAKNVLPYATPQQPGKPRKWPAGYLRHGVCFAYPYGLTTKQELLVLPLSGDRKPIPLTHFDARAEDGRFSPDGRWIAYYSDESGHDEIYVQPFPPTGGKWQISFQGGREPQWRGDGKELFYLHPRGTLMSVDVSAGAGTFAVGPPRSLFQAGGFAVPGKNRYSVTRDGQRFIVSVPIPESTKPITVVLNWFEELKQRVPAH